jgi:hypothetical protein
MQRSVFRSPELQGKDHLWLLFCSNLAQRWREHRTRHLPTATLLLEHFPQLKRRLEEARTQRKEV